MLSANMQFEANFIADNIKMQWHCETGLKENMIKVVEEYRSQRMLTVDYLQDSSRCR
jgi:hypothetical protein